MNQPEKLQQKIDAYLMQLRRSLGELPPDEVTEILQEIRGHILERTEASGELTCGRALVDVSIPTTDISKGDFYTDGWNPALR